MHQRCPRRPHSTRLEEVENAEEPQNWRSPIHENDRDKLKVRPDSWPITYLAWRFWARTGGDSNMMGFEDEGFLISKSKTDRFSATTPRLADVVLAELRRPFIFITLYVVLIGSAFGQQQHLSQMVHTAWTGRNGAPQDINALAETPDGTLWIGSTGGLFSFDGLRFTAFVPVAGDPPFPSNSIRSLFVSKQGDLWIEGSFVGVARLSVGHLTTYGNENIRLLGIQQDSEGTIWGIRNYREIVKLGSDQAWHSVTGPLQHAGYISTLFIDSSDTQWVSEDGRLYKRSKGEMTFDQTNVFTGDHARFSEDGDHIIWIRGKGLKVGESRESSSLLLMNHVGKVLPRRVRFGDVNDLLEPGDGSIWAATSGLGISRIAVRPQYGSKKAQQQARFERFTASDGLTSNTVRSLLRDSDGNVWAGGLKGLDRFERATLIPRTTGSQTGNWSTCTNPQGEVWVESEDTPLAVLRDGQFQAVHRPTGYSKLLCTSDGDVWFLDEAGIGHIHDQRLSQLPTLPHHSGYGMLYNFISFVESPDHDLIASVGSATERGLWKYKEGRWAPFASSIFTGFAHALFIDAHGRLYVGRTDGDIFVLQDAHPVLLRTEHSNLGVISAFSPTPLGLFVFGAEGVAVERNDSFHKLSFARPELAKTVTGLLQCDNGDFWLNGSRGIVRISSREMIAAIQDIQHPIAASEWHEGDYIGPAPFNNPTASVAKSVDGQLWFSTLNGIVSLRSEDMLTAVWPPRLSIKSIVADNLPLDTHDVFRPNPKTVQIRYFAIDLSHPDKVVYKYRLDGVDLDWQAVGTRTEAIYTHLKPGTYTFHVVASSNDGLWSEPVSSAPFTISRAYYQTLWFTGLCIILTLLLLWFLLSLRIRSVAGTIRMRAEERADERVRIARELHDTLLQGVQGLMLTFHVAAQKLPTRDASKDLIERALLTADKLIVEGRNRVTGLRAGLITDAELLQTIQTVASDLGIGGEIQCDISRIGIDSTLQPQVLDQVFWIMREALTNAFRHSGASHVTVEINYAKKVFHATCKDNGKGCVQTDTSVWSREGHWGIWGMRERTAEIGGSINWDSGPGIGTTVSLSVPSNRAYEPRAPFLKRLPFLH
jgi:signal transduction histidine kinase/ligand-binding sensor domain-containing protein